MHKFKGNSDLFSSAAGRSLKLSLFFFSDLKKVIHAFISSRLDYCNALYSDISKGNIHQLHLIQNAAARFLTHSRRSGHISPILAVLHWLPISLRIDFKVLLIVFKALHGQTLSYIHDLLICYCCLRASGKNVLVVPFCHVTKGGWVFSVHTPRLWNSLLEDFRLAKSVSSFKTHLKICFYCKAFN
ncbi:hypothetical protein LDENG_00113430 [Lucifuga dentata]|nr:hypothetical protein LDENG_00113430 [Lucifuga dentata]